MSSVPLRLISPRSRQRAIAVILCTGSVLLSLALAPRVVPLPAARAATDTTATAVKPIVSATLEQCMTSPEQTERAATFAGEMAALPGTAKMQMRIDVLERMPHELLYHEVVAAGLGVWRTAAPGVKTYKYLKEVTNLGAPAFYRAAVRFRWLNARGRVIRSLQMFTPKCEQPVAPVSPTVPEEAGAD
jgi:hypothetical protein